MPILDKIALAVDLPSKEQIETLLKSLNPKPKIIKIGLEVIAALGVGEAIALVTNLCPESKLFLDFKLHDIPNTVFRSTKALKEQYGKQLAFLTVHSLGGSDMLAKALEGSADEFKIAAVTVLTSHSSQALQKDFNLSDNLEINSLVLNLATLAYRSGVRWLVCSPHESKILKKTLPEIKLITPGIRPFTNYTKDDQARPMGLIDAFNNGSDLVVIGRPIYEAPNPQAAWHELLSST